MGQAPSSGERLAYVPYAGRLRPRRGTVQKERSQAPVVVAPYGGGGDLARLFVERPAHHHLDLRRRLRLGSGEADLIENALDGDSVVDVGDDLDLAPAAAAHEGVGLVPTPALSLTAGCPPPRTRAATGRRLCRGSLKIEADEPWLSKV